MNILPFATRFLGKTMLEFQGRVEERPFHLWRALRPWRAEVVRNDAERIGAPSPDGEIFEQDRAALVPRFLPAEQQTNDGFPHAI